MLWVSFMEEWGDTTWLFNTTAICIVLISVDSSVHIGKEHLFTLKIVSCTHHQTVLGEGVISVCVLVKYSLEG